MVQVFLYGAYKSRARPPGWSAYSAALTLAYGLTGYCCLGTTGVLGTVVTTRIAAQAPLLGSYLTRLFGRDESIGVVTFRALLRMHVLLLRRPLRC